MIPKNTHIKKIITLGVLFFASSLFLWNCETEEALLVDQAQTHLNSGKSFERHVVPLKSLEAEHYEAFQILSKLSKKGLDPTNRNQENYSEEYDLYYTLDEVHVIEAQDYEQFSFVVRSSDQQENQFKNYLLYVYPNNEYQQFLVTYQYNDIEEGSFNPVNITELQGSQLLTRSVVNCPNDAELVPQTGTVCTYTLCTGDNHHMYGQSGCTCGVEDPCEPATETCVEQTYYVWQCGGGSTGGTGNDNTNDPNNDNGQTGGGDDTSGNDTGDGSPVFPIEDVETPMDRILKCMNTFSFSGPNITMPQSLIDSLQLDSRCYTPLDNFLQDEGCNFENKSFAIDAARTCLDDIYVNYEDKILFGSNFEGTKVECIYNKLMEASTNFYTAIQKFDGEFPVAHLKLTIDNNLGNTVYGETQPPSNYVIEIKFNDMRFSNLSDLGKVLTFSHEIIHAEIFRKMLSAAKRGDLSSASMTTEESVNYVNSLRENFPLLYKYYWENYRPTWNHNLMADHYRSSIADVMEQFDQNSLSRETYKLLAWAGLGEIENNQTTDAWDALTQIEKENIESLISQYLFSGSSTCN